MSGSCAYMARSEADSNGASDACGPTVEAVMVLFLREAYGLAADYALRNQRSVVCTDDVVRALKVLAHPSCDFLDTLVLPSRAEHASGSKEGLERAVQAIESCALTLCAERVTLRSDGLLGCGPSNRAAGASKYVGMMSTLSCCKTDEDDDEDDEDEEDDGKVYGKDEEDYGKDDGGKDDEGAKDKGDGKSRTADTTPMRRAVAAGVRAMVAHLRRRRRSTPGVQ